MDEGPLGLKILQVSFWHQAILEEARIDRDVREAHENVLGQLRGEVLVKIAKLDGDVSSVHNVDGVLIGQV